MKDRVMPQAVVYQDGTIIEISPDAAKYPGEPRGANYLDMRARQLNEISDGGYSVVSLRPGTYKDGYNRAVVVAKKGTVKVGKAMWTFGFL